MLCHSPKEYSFLKINENSLALVWSCFESDKVNHLHLLSTVMHALKSLLKRPTVLQLTVTGLVLISNSFSESSMCRGTFLSNYLLWRKHLSSVVNNPLLMNPERNKKKKCFSLFLGFEHCLILVLKLVIH